ncbi:prepilin-type N-terminal cleavage/methylation domain-containing protein [Enterococcus wangshanyuanii]|uniref:Prepilin-type N-terminal cleavage/methylation domain-containing protein n=1 Tax=Enterococcus wangshanyuanii TaxID=2005703 RepID=A0ABQ1PLN8_9ENTE|nr:prepilin-type N-terminal cleavage/methylation domain-containing protein [Enterococcus wangshanyuanii]GGC99381.1 hypothetical protein GCM10011573_31190 [Enterococcus wangshanyuanii]
MFKNVMKDERGLSLVELLAVVVIMAIIAGIGAVAISSVIQKNREDAGISNVQSLVSAANLYQMSETGDAAIGGGAAAVTAADLVTKNYISQAGFLATPANVTFDATTTGKILITVPANMLTAGSRKNKEIKYYNEKEVADLTREILWESGATGTDTPAP